MVYWLITDERHINKAAIGSDNGLFPVRHQAIIWIYGGLL